MADIIKDYIVKVKKGYLRGHRSRDIKDSTGKLHDFWYLKCSGKGKIEYQSFRPGWCHSCYQSSSLPHKPWRSLSYILGSLLKFPQTCNPPVPAKNPDIACCWNTRFCIEKVVHLAEEVWVVGFRWRFQLRFWIHGEIFFSFLELAGRSGVLVFVGGGLHLKEEFLSVGADLCSGARLEELFDFLPVLAVEAEACVRKGVPSRKRRCSSWVHLPLDLAGVSANSYIWIFGI